MKLGLMGAEDDVGEGRGKKRSHGLDGFRVEEAVGLLAGGAEEYRQERRHWWRGIGFFGGEEKGEGKSTVTGWAGFFLFVEKKL